MFTSETSETSKISELPELIIDKPETSKLFKSIKSINKVINMPIN